MMAIRDLQRNNADLEDKLKIVTQKYDTLVDLTFGINASNPHPDTK